MTSPIDSSIPPLTNISFAEVEKNPERVKKQNLEEFNNTFDSLARALELFNACVSMSNVGGVQAIEGVMKTSKSSLDSKYQELIQDSPAGTFDEEESLIQKMDVALENARILKPEEVKKALNVQNIRARIAYGTNSELKTQFPYSAFSYKPCKGTKLNLEDCWPAKDSDPNADKPFYYKSTFIPGCQAGVCEAQGDRPAMEDAHLLTSIEIDTPEGGKHIIPLLGVFDGHSGSEASSYVRDQLPAELKKKLGFFLQFEKTEILSDSVIYNALKSSLVTLHQEYDRREDGTTANLLVIVNGNLYTANVGDSRSVLVKNKIEESCCERLTHCVLGESDEPRGLQLSEDAKPDNPRHKKIIEALGGTVDWVQRHERFRVNKNLSIGSALGDHFCQGMNPTVDITKTPLPDEGGKIVIGCDGLWDAVTSEKIINLLSDPDLINGKSDETLAKNLAYSAWFASSEDNISVIVATILPAIDRNAERTTL